MFSLQMAHMNTREQTSSKTSPTTVNTVAAFMQSLSSTKTSAVTAHTEEMHPHVITDERYAVSARGRKAWSVSTAYNNNENL